jgi:hypothetical protein
MQSPDTETIYGFVMMNYEYNYSSSETLSIVLHFILLHDVPETLSPSSMEASNLGPVERANLCQRRALSDPAQRVPPEAGDRAQLRNIVF